MPGGTQAILEPWRNAYAWLRELGDWQSTRGSCADLALVEFLARKPLASLDAMIGKDLNSPLTSSCGRLFDAVAAAIGVCRERIQYEGQAAIELEALIDRAALDGAAGYTFVIETGDTLVIDPVPMWRELLADLSAGELPRIMAARFHKGLADAVCKTAGGIADRQQIGSIALSGGVFQNATLLTLVERQLSLDGYRVLSHETMPANDGGLAPGQAVIAAARAINEVNH
jgi:hydrogenase maturation protein HypF